MNPLTMNLVMIVLIASIHIVAIVAAWRQSRVERTA